MGVGVEQRPHPKEVSPEEDTGSSTLGTRTERVSTSVVGFGKTDVSGRSVSAGEILMRAVAGN